MTRQDKEIVKDPREQPTSNRVKEKGDEYKTHTTRELDFSGESADLDRSRTGSSCDRGHNRAGPPRQWDHPRQVALPTLGIQDFWLVVRDMVVREEKTEANRTPGGLTRNSKRNAGRSGSPGERANKAGIIFETVSIIVNKGYIPKLTSELTLQAWRKGLNGMGKYRNRPAECFEPKNRTRSEFTKRWTAIETLRLVKKHTSRSTFQSAKSYNT